MHAADIHLDMAPWLRTRARRLLHVRSGRQLRTVFSLVVLDTGRSPVLHA